MVAIVVACGTAVFIALAEAIHIYRCSRIARLAFGPNGFPSLLGFLSPLARIAASALLVWGLITLMVIEPKVVARDRTNDIKPEEIKHLVLLLDVSPSMHLEDAGADRKQKRIHRASALVDSFFERVQLQQYRISMVAVYSGAKPVVVDTTDIEVVRYALDDLPMHFAFKAGKTELLTGFEEAARIAKPWRPNSTTVMMITDGDTVPATGMPTMPAAVKNVVVVGVGDPRQGKFIDGKQSKQEVSTLRQIAARLQGDYHNGNEKHLPTDLIQSWESSEGDNPLTNLTLREYALIACGLGSFTLAILPFLLHYLGSFWVPGIRRQNPQPQLVTQQGMTQGY